MVGKRSDTVLCAQALEIELRGFELHRPRRYGLLQFGEAGSQSTRQQGEPNGNDDRQ